MSKGRKFNLQGKTLVITGAASGIGRALAIESVRRGASVAIADLNLEGCVETQALTEEKKSGDALCSVHQLDVSSLEAWQAFRQEVLTHQGKIDGVINNAGITFAGSIEDMTYQQLDRVMSINFMGMVYGSKEFLPDLLARPEALIANVSSVFGLYPMKRQGAYCASKYAIRGFTEVLAQELQSTTVTVSTVHPGHIGTDIIKNAAEQGDVAVDEFTEQEKEAWMKAFKALGMNPQKAAQTILDGLESRRRKILVGKDAVRGDRMSRMFPKGFADSVNKVAG